MGYIQSEEYFTVCMINQHNEISYDLKIHCVDLFKIEIYSSLLYK